MTAQPSAQTFPTSCPVTVPTASVWPVSFSAQTTGWLFLNDDAASSLFFAYILIVVCVCRCVVQNSTCDGQNDCGDNSDEENCTCTSSQFRCNSGHCISNTFRCDRDPDCVDASDEMGCPTRPNCVRGTSTQAQEMQNCANTTACLHPSWICDGANDCWDNSDEQNCSTTPASSQASCPSTSFVCRNGKCITSAWLCDRDDDCEDSVDGGLSSDEANCAYTCRPDQFKCNNSDCIPSMWRCDGTEDCSDGSGKFSSHQWM